MSSGFEEIQEEDLMAPETSNEPLTPPTSSVEPVFTESAPPASVFGFDNETHHDINDVDQIDPYADKEGHFEQEDVTSSYENIIPPQVRRGWGVFFSWAATTAAHVKETAMEINNSETVKEMKTKTTEAMTPIYQAADPLWQKTVETAAPIWVRTKESLAHAADVTSESAAAAAENVMPTLDAISESAASGWKSFSTVAAKWIDGDSAEGASASPDSTTAPANSSSNSSGSSSTSSSDSTTSFEQGGTILL